MTRGLYTILYILSYYLELGISLKGSSFNICKGDEDAMTWYDALYMCRCVRVLSASLSPSPLGSANLPLYRYMSEYKCLAKAAGEAGRLADTHTHTDTHTHRERERERDTDRDTHVAACKHA